ncbi:MAG: acetyl-CoA carboxylase, biotin carboxyl carrier protein [Candidatus Marinimicrobia bacterium]|nr:acetyl-CoA carboxylase, biotin carboxyl carrier protein [Candidatus Neomarinimicrobiota bacterium]
MWQDKLKEIIYLLEHSKVNEIEVRYWGKTYRVVKSASSNVIAGDSIQTSQLSSQVGTEAVNPQESQGAETTVPNKSTGEKINSPMPGTFYRASSPDSDPFVKEGDQVVAGDTLCIIEAMKIMNEIESEQNGTIDKILVNDGTPVEYDQPLFTIHSE